MIFTPNEARMVDALREAANEHEEVSNLLQILASILAIEHDVVSINSDAADRAYLEAVLIAAAFAACDDVEAGRA